MAEIRIHQGQKLKQLVENNKLKQSEILNLTGFAKSSLYEIYKKEDVPRATLEKLCNVLNEDIRQFFPELVRIGGDPGEDYEYLKQRVKSLEQIVHDKEMIIHTQQELIDLLKQKNKR